jgi:hypothetical protein
VHLTVAELGVLLLVLYGVFHYLRILATARAVLAFLGAVAVGLAGTAGRIAGDLAGWAQHAVGSVTAWAFGVPLTAGLFIALVVLLAHDLHPRKGASARTGYVALAVGILLVAGVSQFPALAPAVNGIRSMLSGVANFINTL